MHKEVVLSLAEFTEMVQLIKDLKEANKALNEQIREFNKYAEDSNERSE